MNETDAKLQFGKVLRWWFGLQELQNHPRTFMVLCILATYADGTSGVIPRKASPSRNTLAALAGVEPRHISNHVRLLEALELVTVERSSGRKSQYTVALTPKTSDAHNTALAKIATQTSDSHNTGSGIASVTGLPKAVLPASPISYLGQTKSDHYGDVGKEETDDAIISRLVSHGYDELQARKATKKNRSLAALWSRINPSDYSWATNGLGGVIGAGIRDGVPPKKTAAPKPSGQNLKIVVERETKVEDVLATAWRTITDYCEILQSEREWRQRNNTAAGDLVDMGKSAERVGEMLEAALESEFYANITTLEALKRNWAQIDSLHEKLVAHRYAHGHYLRVL